MSATARKYALIGLFSIPFLTVIFLWSGSGGWLFFCFETSLLFLAVGGPALEDGCPVAFMGLFGFLSAVACWWLQGRFWRYCFLLVFEVGLGIFFFLACQGVSIMHSRRIYMRKMAFGGLLASTIELSLFGNVVCFCVVLCCVSALLLTLF